MIGRIHDWVLKGRFDPSLERLEVTFDGWADGRDLMTATSGLLGEIQQQLEYLQTAANRRRTAPTVSPDAELRQLTRALLPSLDALDRIIEMGDSSRTADEAFMNWLASVRAVRIRMLKTLEGIGLTPIAAVGTEVDLEIHDVVSIVPAGQYPANTVVAEQQRGYFFKGKLLRDAKVVVAQ